MAEHDPKVSPESACRINPALHELVMKFIRPPEIPEFKFGKVRSLLLTLTENPQHVFKAAPRPESEANEIERRVSPWVERERRFLGVKDKRQR